MNNKRSYSVKILQDAVSQDSNGNYSAALTLYMQGLDILIPIMQNETDPTQKQFLRQKIKEYLDRAELLKQTIKNTPQQEKYSQNQHTHCIPSTTHTDTISTNTMTSNAEDAFSATKVVELALTGGKMLNDINNEYGVVNKLGGATVNGIGKLMELDKEYNIHQKVGSCIYSGAQTAYELDKEYQIHQKVGNVISTGITKAQEVNDQYNVTQTISNTLSTGFQKGKQLDEEYKIHETIGEGIMTGIAKAKEINSQYKISETVGSFLGTGLNTIYNGIVNTNDT